MIARVWRNRNLSGLVAYIFRPDANPVRLPGNTAASSVEQFRKCLSSVMNSRLGYINPGWHFMLSLTPGENLTAARWALLSESFISAMAICSSDRPWCGAIHQNRPHEHVHLIVPRRNYIGELHYGGFDQWRAMQAAEILEVQFDLQPARDRSRKRAPLTAS